MISNTLLRLFDERWRDLEADLAATKRALSQVSIQERAEVAASVPVYDTTSDFPTAGTLGRWAADESTGDLYFDNGTAWKKVTVT